jgi:hypothetical protein
VDTQNIHRQPKERRQTDIQSVKQAMERKVRLLDRLSAITDSAKETNGQAKRHLLRIIQYLCVLNRCDKIYTAGREIPRDCCH